MKDRLMMVLVVVLGLCALWFSGSSLWKATQYLRLSSSISPQAISWSVEEKSDERYLLHGNYTFMVNGKQFHGEDTLQSPFFLNPWATEQAIKNKSFDQPLVWYSAGNPHYSSLQKKFPLKECLSALILWGLVMYFYGLDYYVARVK